ncbi:MAG TPA: XcyI family restriction endonuclease [Acidobacteriota bacterium]|nr:XcyI family restriction endonuclease [Acidobacteriota bacterium]
MTPADPILPVLKPDLQVTFYYRLQTLRELYLQDALKQTVQLLDISALDDELAQYVDESALARVAADGIRGEVFFPVPLLLTANPHLLGYYRLLYGLSQKEFYGKGPFGRFKKLEDDGDLLAPRKEEIPHLCRSLVQTGQILVEGLDNLSRATAHDLQLLTIGPQLRGSENTRLGRALLPATNSSTWTASRLPPMRKPGNSESSSAL